MTSRSLLASVALCSVTFAAAPPALAVEGGIGAYFLGSRDTLAGIVPGPGTYVGLDFIGFSGTVGDVSIGGFPVVEAEIDTTVYKLSLTQVFSGSVLGGTPALNINLPYADAELTFLGPLANGITDDRSGAGDIVITPIVGWHDGFRHWSMGLSVFAPTGEYEPSVVNVPDREVDVLNIGKNVWGFQPVVAGTYLNTDNGREFSGAASVLFTTMNDATDYQTAPQFTLEGAALQHLPSGWALGLSGYYYQQLGDDSGRGATETKVILGIDSLSARVFGLGPIVTYSGSIGDTPVSLKLKYTQEFGAKRRFESDVLWLNLATSF